MIEAASISFKTTDPTGPIPPIASDGPLPLTAAWAQTVLKEIDAASKECDYE